MTPEQTKLAIIATEMILTHGVPTFISAVQSLNTTEPTLEDIQGLRDLVKPASEYFDEPAGK